MNFSVLLDVSKSMDYGSRGITKFDYARILTACLTNSCTTSATAVGSWRSTPTSSSTCRLVAKHMETMLHVLDRLKPGGRAA
jgi:uncharacterized protein (DUF58 family)